MILKEPFAAYFEVQTFCLRGLRKTMRNLSRGVWSPWPPEYEQEGYPLDWTVTVCAADVHLWQIVVPLYETNHTSCIKLLRDDRLFIYFVYSWILNLG
jgi:hypothetical protein